LEFINICFSKEKKNDEKIRKTMARLIVYGWNVAVVILMALLHTELASVLDL
jgi:hypothetical protein